MAGMIDADALKAEFDKNCAMECACCDHATCNHVGNAVGCGLVDAAPTIPAITVEWLEQQRDKRRAAAAAHSNISSRTVLEAINVVMELWQKEQEAR